MTISTETYERDPSGPSTGQSSWDLSKDAAVLPASDDAFRRPQTSSFGSEAAATVAKRELRVISPLARPHRQPTARQFQALARWEGAIVEVFDTYFVAEVIDLANGERAIAEFEMADLAEFDRPLCKPGALFYWSIGYEVKGSGQRYRASVIRFRRLGKGFGSGK